jgi:hypothetical protein
MPSEIVRWPNLEPRAINIELHTLTTSELTDLYNQHAEKPIKRFADRATALKRTQAVLPAEPAAKLDPAANKAWTEQMREAHRATLTMNRRVVNMTTGHASRPAAGVRPRLELCDPSGDNAARMGRPRP